MSKKTNIKAPANSSPDNKRPKVVGDTTQQKMSDGDLPDTGEVKLNGMSGVSMSDREEGYTHHPKDEIISNVLMSKPKAEVHQVLGNGTQDSISFSIIPNQQTPKADEMTPIDHFLRVNAEVLKGVKMLAETSPRAAAGLAANQCALNNTRIPLRFFVYFNGGCFRHIIDPVLEDKYGMKLNKIEGCLTWDSQKVMADRWAKIRVSYYDIEGVKHTNEEFRGSVAQVFQHEISHLEGVKENLVPFGATETYPKKYERNAPCPCGSGIKYKKCCL